MRRVIEIASAAALIMAAGCASSAPPSPIEDVRALRPGAEIAQEVSTATVTLIEKEGYSRARFATSLNPEDASEAKSAPSGDAPEPPARAIRPECEGKTGEALPESCIRAAPSEAPGDATTTDATTDEATTDEAKAPEREPSE